MNAEAEEVAAGLFLRTLWSAFAGSAARAAIRAPLRPWAEILVGPARAQLEREGVRVHDGYRATSIAFANDVVRSLSFDRHPDVVVGASAAVVSALPWHALGRLVPTPGSELVGSPIVSVYFEGVGAAQLPDDPVVALVDGDPFHFYCRAPGAPSGTFALVAGAARALDGWSTRAIEECGRAHLRRYFPGADTTGGRAKVVRENRATFVSGPHTDSLRPRPGRHPAARNLFVCGDWTQTELPATLEGAAVSATRAVGEFDRSRLRVADAVG
jgi:hypothetical protein